MSKNPFRHFKTSPEIIQLAVMIYVRFPLSLRNVEDLLHERDIDVCHESVRLWRAVDHEGEVLESFVTKTRDKVDALKLIRKAMKRYGAPWKVVTDRLASYGAAMKEIGNIDRQEVGRHLNNRAENSHLPFRRRERAMPRFRRMSHLQKFASMHSSVHVHFNSQRNIESRARFKSLRDTALLQWRELFAAKDPLPRENQRLVLMNLTASQ